LNDYLNTYCPDESFQELVEFASEDRIDIPEFAIVCEWEVVVVVFYC
jgi:hypothetical protein